MCQGVRYVGFCFFFPPSYARQNFKLAVCLCLFHGHLLLGTLILLSDYTPDISVHNSVIEFITPIMSNYAFALLLTCSGTYTGLLLWCSQVFRTPHSTVPNALLLGPIWPNHRQYLLLWLSELAMLVGIPKLFLVLLTLPGIFFYFYLLNLLR